jgi:hypothetical protein
MLSRMIQLGGIYGRSDVVLTWIIRSQSGMQPTRWRSTYEVALKSSDVCPICSCTCDAEARIERVGRLWLQQSWAERRVVTAEGFYYARSLGWIIRGQSVKQCLIKKYILRSIDVQVVIKFNLLPGLKRKSIRPPWHMVCVISSLGWHGVTSYGEVDLTPSPS